MASEFITAEAVAEYEAIRPVNVVPVELDGFVVVLFRVGPQAALDILPRGDAA